MQKRPNSAGLTTLILVLVIGSAGLYLSHKKDRELIALNEMKSQLTPPPTPTNRLSGLKDLLTKKNQPNIEPQSSPEPVNVLMRERIYTEEEVNQMSEGQFEELLAETERKLPKRSDLKKIPAEALHHTPSLVIQAGRDLGLIKEVLKVHESYERVAQPFYNSCAKSEEGVTPVRALCLTNLIEIKKKNGEKLNLKEYPEQIIELTKMVTEL